LPEIPSMRTHFGDGEVNPLVSGPPQSTTWGGLEAGQRALQTAYAELMAAHRICPPIPPFLMPRINADGGIDPQPTDAALQQWIERFHITGFPIQFLGMEGRGWQDDPLGADRKRNARYLRSMYTYLRAHHWEKMAYIYVADEPVRRRRTTMFVLVPSSSARWCRASRCFAQSGLRSRTRRGGAWWAGWIYGRPFGRCLGSRL